MKRDRLVEILKAGDLTAIEGMVRDESQGKYTGHLAVHRDAFRSWCEFDSTFEKLVADETLVLLRPGKKVRIGGEKNARSTWVVFAKHASLAEGENPNNEGGPGCAGGVAHPSKGEEMGGGA